MGEDRMKVRYDPEADVLYLLVKEGEISETIEAGEDLFVEIDEAGGIAGVEIWRARSSVFGELLKYMDRIKEMRAK